MPALTDEQRIAAIETINELAEEVAQAIEWRTDGRLKDTWTTSGWMKMLEIAFKLEGGRTYKYLLSNEGVLHMPAIVSQPVTLRHRSNDVLVALEQALRLRLAQLEAAKKPVTPN